MAPIKRKDYYNLQRSAGKRTPETELDRAVRNLELKGFHVRFSEKYQVEGDIRSRRIVEHFFLQYRTNSPGSTVR